ncbi:TPA: hypothetical protein QFT37_002300 [Enterococcus faecium]
MKRTTIGTIVSGLDSFLQTFHYRTCFWNGGSDRFERLGRKYGANARWFHAMLTGRIL